MTQKGIHHRAVFVNAVHADFNYWSAVGRKLNEFRLVPTFSWHAPEFEDVLTGIELGIGKPLDSTRTRLLVHPADPLSPIGSDLQILLEIFAEDLTSEEVEKDFINTSVDCDLVEGMNQWAQDFHCLLRECWKVNRGITLMIGDAIILNFLFGVFRSRHPSEMGSLWRKGGVLIADFVDGEYVEGECHSRFPQTTVLQKIRIR